MTKLQTLWNLEQRFMRRFRQLDRLARKKAFKDDLESIRCSTAAAAFKECAQQAKRERALHRAHNEVFR